MLRDKHDKRLYVKQFYFFIRFTASCSPLNAPSNGNLHNNQTKHGTVVSFSCNSGFKLKGVRQIMCVDGKWNGSSPACKGLSLSYAVLNFPRRFSPFCHDSDVISHAQLLNKTMSWCQNVGRDLAELSDQPDKRTLYIISRLDFLD